MSSYHYVKLSAEEYPRLYATPNLRDDGSYYAGPFRKASLARRFVDCVNGAYPLRTCAHLPRERRREHACQRAGTGACLSPCSRPLNGEYAAVVADVRRVLEGHADDLDRRLRRAPGRRSSRRSRSSRRRACRTSARRWRACVRGVLRLRAAQRDDLVLVYPARRRGWVALWGVRAGGIVVEREVGREAFGEQAARGLLAELAAAEPPRPPLPAAAIDEMLLVHSWTERAPRRARTSSTCARSSRRRGRRVRAAGLLRAARLAARRRGARRGPDGRATSAIAAHPAPAAPIAP